MGKQLLFWAWKNRIIKKCGSLMMLYYLINELTDSETTLPPDSFFCVGINIYSIAYFTVVWASLLAANSVVSDMMTLRKHMAWGELVPENLCLASVTTPFYLGNLNHQYFSWLLQLEWKKNWRHEKISRHIAKCPLQDVCQNMEL